MEFAAPANEVRSMSFFFGAFVLFAGGSARPALNLGRRN
jgi:hypothetical protein